MAFKLTEWPFLIARYPDRAKARIKTALTKTGGNVTKAAALLGLSRRSLTGFIARLRMEKEVEAAREAERKRKAAEFANRSEASKAKVAEISGGEP